MKPFSSVNRGLSKLSAYLGASKKRAFFAGSLIYTAMFLLFFMLSVYPVIRDTGAYLGGDGVGQYYPFLMDFRSNTIDFIESVKNGSPQLTMMNFDYFYGTDTIASTTFMFVPFLPYFFFSAFVSEAALPLFFAVGTVLLAYIAGFSFMSLCAHFGKNMLWGGFSAVFYVFCGNYFFTASLNPHFMYMYIAFPLMVIGMDRILTGKGCGLFVLSVWWLSLSGIPFIVYTIPFVIVFAVIRVYFLYKGRFWRSLGKYFLRGSLLTLIALAMAAVPHMIFLDEYLSGMRTSGGMSISIAELLIPSVDYLAETLDGAASNAPTGVCAALVPCFIYMLTSPRAKKEAKVHSAVMLCLVALPLIRYGLNMFSYELCRWGFVPAALICFCFTAYIPAMLRTNKTERGMFIFIILGYTLALTLKAETAAMIFLLVMGIINAVPALRRLFLKLVKRGASALKAAFKRKSIVLLAVGSVTLLGLIISVFLILSFRNYNILPMLLTAVAATVILVCLASKKGFKAVSSALLAAVYIVTGVMYASDPHLEPYKLQESLIFEAVSQLEAAENTFDRTASLRLDCSIQILDRSGGLFPTEEMKELQEAEKSDEPVYGEDPYINLALRYGLAEPAVFRSTVNGDYMRFLKRCGQDGTSFFSTVDMSGFSGKEVLYSLFGYDKFHAYTDQGRFYGITQQDYIATADNDGVFIYYNDYALPAGVTYDTYSSYKEFDSYNSAELPYAMMSSIYLEGYETSEYDGKTYSEECDFTLKQESRGETSLGIECFDNYITPETDLSGCFVYLSFEGVVCDTYEGGSSEIFTIEVGENKYNYLIHNSNYAWEWKYYSDLYTLSLGFWEDGNDEIYFISPFEFESVKLYAIPEEVYTSAYEERTAEILENVEMSTNTLTGDITVSADKTLCVNMLYSRGWTAYIDGEEAPVYKANGLFLGIPLTAGSHTVRLVYRSPWLYEGLAVSAAATAVFAVILILQKKKSAKK